MIATSRGVFWSATALSVACMAVLQWSGAGLRTAAAPVGIVSFEFAGTAAIADEIVASWSESARRDAAFNLGFDFLFLFAYSTGIAAACLLAAAPFRRRGSRLAALGRPLAWAQAAAAACDAAENFALLSMLRDSPTNVAATIAWWCAAVKFAIVFLGLGYAALGLVAKVASSDRPGGA